MSVASRGEVTELLLAWSGGEESALDKLVPLLHPELRRLAHRYMRGVEPSTPHLVARMAFVYQPMFPAVVPWRMRNGRSSRMEIPANTRSLLIPSIRL